MPQGMWCGIACKVLQSIHQPCKQTTLPQGRLLQTLCGCSKCLYGLITTATTNIDRLHHKRHQLRKMQV